MKENKLKWFWIGKKFSVKLFYIIFLAGKKFEMYQKLGKQVQYCFVTKTNVTQLIQQHGIEWIVSLSANWDQSPKKKKKKVTQLEDSW